MTNLIIFLIHYLVKFQKVEKNTHHNHPEPKITSSHVKHILFTIIYNKEKQEVLLCDLILIFFLFNNQLFDKFLQL